MQWRSRVERGIGRRPTKQSSKSNNPAQPPPPSLRGGAADAAIQSIQQRLWPHAFFNPLDRHGLWPRDDGASSLRAKHQPAGRRTPCSGGPEWNEGLAAGQQSNPANPTPRRSPPPRHGEEAQPTRQSSPSNNASGHMPFLTRWIATAYGLAMTAPRHCEQRTSPQGAGRHAVAVPRGTRDWPQANKAIQQIQQPGAATTPVIARRRSRRL